MICVTVANNSFCFGFIDCRDGYGNLVKNATSYNPYVIDKTDPCVECTCLVGVKRYQLHERTLAHSKKNLFILIFFFTFHLVHYIWRTLTKSYLNDRTALSHVRKDRKKNAKSRKISVEKRKAGRVNVKRGKEKGKLKRQLERGVPKGEVKLKVGVLDSSYVQYIYHGLPLFRFSFQDSMIKTIL